MASQYRLSRASVRGALKELAAEGLVRTVRGKGTVVVHDGSGQRERVRLVIYVPAFEMPQWQAALAALAHAFSPIQVHRFGL